MVFFKSSFFLIKIDKQFCLGLFLVLLLISKTNNSFAQKFEFGAGLGAIHYRGDIAPKFNPLQSHVGVNLLGRYHISKAIALRANVLAGKYKYDSERVTDPFYKARLLESTQANIVEMAGIAEYKFFNTIDRPKFQEWQMYLFGGVGLTYFTEKNSNIITVNIANVKKLTSSLLYGIGVKKRFSGPLSLNAEFGSRFIFTDKLDASSNGNVLYFANRNTYEGNLITTRKLSSDATRKDQYFMTKVSLTYTIFKMSCPDDNILKK